MLFRYIEQAFSFIEIGEKAIADMHNLQSGEINIGASDTLCKYYFLPHLEYFHATYPDIRIRISNRTTPETLSLLKEGKIDFGIVHLPATDKQIDFRASSPIHDCLVAGKSFVERAQLQHPCPFAISGTTRAYAGEGREHKKLCRSICRAAGSDAETRVRAWRH